MKAVGYVRVSTDEQSLSPEVQKQVLSDLAHSRGIEIVKWFEDIGISGGIPCLLRPAFKEMLDFCLKHNIKIILAYSLDRLSRYQKDIDFLIYELVGRKGFTIITLRDGEYSRDKLDPEKRAFLQFRKVVADLERYYTRIRTRDAMRKKFPNGTPWGFFSKLTHEVEEKIIQLFKQGYSILKIARELNVNRRVVYYILWKHGLWQLPEDTCPRCLSKMVEDDQFVGYYYCRKCGFLKPIAQKEQTIKTE